MDHWMSLYFLRIQLWSKLHIHVTFWINLISLWSCWGGFFFVLGRLHTWNSSSLTCTVSTGVLTTAGLVSCHTKPERLVSIFCPVCHTPGREGRNKNVCFLDVAREAFLVLCEGTCIFPRTEHTTERLLKERWRIDKKVICLQFNFTLVGYFRERVYAQVKNI